MERFTATDLQAQGSGRYSHPSADILSLGLYGGGLFSPSTLGVEAEFDDTGTVGATATLWVHRNVGIRGIVLWSPPDVVGLYPGALAEEDPNVWHHSGDVVLRLPLPAARLSWYPYLVGGLGSKTYDFETLGTETDFAGNFGAGLEVRFDETLNDVIWTGGLSLNF